LTLTHILPTLRLSIPDPLQPNLWPIPGEARLIGRTSVAHTVAAHLRPSGETLAEAQLPRDVRAGDLIAVPCAGPTALHDVRRHAHHPERLAD
jgi:hypothetical protein